MLLGIPATQRVSSLVTVALMVAMLVGCTSPAAVTPSPNGGSLAPSSVTEPSIAPSDSDTLVVAAATSPAAFDIEKVFNPGALEMVETLYDHLVTSKRVESGDGLWEYDFTQTEPELAERWEVSPDGMAYTFYLRHGVMSSFGNEFTSADVKWRWERMWDLKANGLNFFAQAGLDGPDDVEVIDDYTVRFNLNAPNAIFLKLMQNALLYYIDSTEAQLHSTADDPWAVSWTEQNAAGYGPYRVAEFTPGQQTVLEAQEDYWRGELPIKRIIYREVPSAAIRSQLVQAGEVDLALGLDANLIVDLQDNPDVNVLSWTSNNQVSLVMNVTKAPFDDKRVRQAISYAVPYDDIISSVYRGIATRWKSPVPAVFPGYTDAYWLYDTNLDEARRLLNDANVTELDLPLSFSDAQPAHEAIAVLLQTQLAQIGINVTLEKLPSAQFAQKSAAKELPFLIYQGAAGTPDIAFAMQLYLVGQAGPNYSQYNNPQLNELVAESFRSSDEAERLELFDDMQRIVVDDAPWAYLANPGFHVVARHGVENVTWYPVNVLRIGEITKGSE